MNKKYLFVFSLFLGLFFIMGSCIEEPDVIVASPEIESESLSYMSNSARIIGTYSYPTRLKNILLHVGETNDLQHSGYSGADLNDNGFEVYISNLKPNKQYYYCYELITSMNSIKTEVKSFKTTSLLTK